MQIGLNRASELAEGADRRAIWIVAGFLVARLVFASLLGPGIDESYTLAIARSLSLSYFDHPPLHQWIAHFAALVFGEGLATRLPFIVLFAATGWIVYRLTDDLFGVRAATIALFSLNVAPFFFASAGTWVMPDGPLLFGLAIAAWALARLFFDTPPGRASVWGLWLLAGVGLGVAGLSKYTAALSAAGLLAFVLLAPRQRRWLDRPAPYVAAAVALAMIAPVLVWNAQHGWASFQFQGGRGSPGGGLKPVQVLLMALGEAAYLWPWIFVPLVAGLAEAWRRRLGRAAAFPALSRLAADRPFHRHAALGRARPPPLDHARLVLRLPADGRVAGQTGDRRQLIAPLGLHLCGPAGGRRDGVGRASLDRLAFAFGADSRPASPTQRWRRSIGASCARRPRSFPGPPSSSRRRGRMRGKLRWRWGRTFPSLSFPGTREDGRSSTAEPRILDATGCLSPEPRTSRRRLQW